MTQQFFCDCTLTSKLTTDIFEGSYRCGAKNDERCGVFSDGNGKCSVLMKFASREACYKGYCAELVEEAAGGLSGGAKFAVVLAVFAALQV